MSRAFLYALLFALLPLAASAQAAKDEVPTKAAPESTVFTAETAFQYLTTLDGDWQRAAGAADHEHTGATRGVNFHTTAGHSSVMEVLYPGSPTEMINMFHMNNDDLLLTHYCALGNAPIMKFEKSDKPGQIKFVFYGGTNFDPKTDAHVHEGVYQVIDGNTIVSSFISHSDGQPKPVGRAILKRQPK
jgi:hypothetical protein